MQNYSTSPPHLLLRVLFISWSHGIYNGVLNALTSFFRKTRVLCLIIAFQITCQIVYAQTCSPGPGLAHWSFDNASDEQIDNSSGIPSSGGESCVGKLLKRTDGGSNSTYVSTVGNVDSDYGPVCGGTKSICTGTWDKATAFDRYISITTTFAKGIKGRLSGIAFCEMTMARTKSGGGFNSNNMPEYYRVRLRKRVNGGSWTVVWTGAQKSTTKRDWTGTSSNPVPPSSWGNYNSSNDGLTLQTTDGTATVEFEFQISAYQTSNSTSAQEIWDIDEVDVSGCCEPLPCTPTSELVSWNFDNASDTQIDNSSGIPANGGSYSGCATVLLKRTDGGSNSVYTNSSSSGDYGPVCSSSKSICTGTWDKATAFERYISVKATFPAGKASRLYGISFCEMTMNKTKSGGGFVNNNQPENYRVRLLKNGTVVWTGSVKSTTKTTWASATSTPPTDWGNYNASTDGLSVQTTDGTAQVIYEFQISAYQSSASSSSQEIWDLDEVKVFGCCDDACVTPAKPVGVDGARCGPGTINLTATGCTDGSLNWYTASTGGSVIATGSTFTTPSLTATKTYYVSCQEGLCESGRDPAVATVNAVPSTPAGNDANRCGTGTVTLTATGCTGGTYQWFAGPSGGTVLGTAASFTTPSLTTTATYYVSCKVGSCFSGRDAAVATIKTPPTLTVSTTACSADLTTFSVSFTTNGTVTSDKGTVSGTTVSGIPSGQTATLTATLNGCTTTRTVTKSCACPTVNVPVSGGNKTICEGTAIPALTVTVGTGESANWYDAAGNQVAANTLSYTPAAAGSYFAEAYNTTSNCESNGKTEVKLIINPNPEGGLVTGPTTVCAGNANFPAGAFTLTGQVGTVVRWEWSLDNTNWTNWGNAGSTASPAGAVTSPGTFYVRVVVTNGNCGEALSTVETTQVVQTVGGTVSGPDAVCAGTENFPAGTFTLSGHVGTVVRWEWSLDNTNWTNRGNAGSTASPAGFVNSPGTFYVRVIVKNGDCTEAVSSVKTVSISQPTLTIGTPVCSADNLTYSVTFTTNGTVTADKGTVSGTTVSGIPSGQTVTLTATLNGCTVKATATQTCQSSCVKPNAGPDQTLMCNNGILPTSFDLADAAAGQKWKIISPVPAGASISVVTPSGAVSGTITAGIYKFRLQTQSDSVACADTVQVTVEACAGCIKPNAGPDQTLTCGTVAPTTADLADAAAGQKWKVLKVQPGTTVTVTTPSGAVTGMNLPGAYQFVLQTQSDSLACRDTVTVTVPNCSCPSVNVVTPNATVCKDSLFPTLTVTVTGSNTAGVSAAWYANAIGGSSLATGLSFKPSGTASVTDTFYVQLTGVAGNCSQNPRTAVVVTVQNCSVKVDLALKKLISKKIAQIGDELTYTLKVYNQSNTGATGVEVTDSIATTVQFVSGSFTASRGTAAISGNVIRWTIGNIASNGDTVTLTYRIKATQEGVHFNTAEICKTNEKDVDSTPCNHDDTEDDLDRQCFTVPFKLCPGEKVEATVPTHLTNVQWFKNGGTTAVATGNRVLLSDIGTYTFTASNQTCPASGCCPIIIETSDNCCPEEVCIPFTVKKRRK